MNEEDVQKLIGAMKSVFPTAEMVQAGFASTASEAEVKELREDVHGMYQEMNTRFDKIDRDMQTVIHLQRLDEEMAGVYQRLKTLEQEAGISTN